MWAVFRGDWIEWAKLEAIELACPEVGRVLLVLALSGEASNNSNRRLAKVAISENLDLVGLVGGLGRHHTQTQTFIR